MISLRAAVSAREAVRWAEPVLGSGRVVGMRFSFFKGGERIHSANAMPPQSTLWRWSKPAPPCPVDQGGLTEGFNRPRLRCRRQGGQTLQQSCTVHGASLMGGDVQT